VKAQTKLATLVKEVKLSLFIYFANSCEGSKSISRLVYPGKQKLHFSLILYAKVSRLGTIQSIICTTFGAWRFIWLASA
jgi:hypothetical protein